MSQIDSTQHITTAVALDEPLMTADQVAVLLAVPRSTVYEYARRRHDPLPSIEVGRHRRFTRADVSAWLSGRRTAPRHDAAAAPGQSTSL